MPRRTEYHRLRLQHTARLERLWEWGATVLFFGIVMATTAWQAI